jgi:hypothetical protein
MPDTVKKSSRTVKKIYNIDNYTLIRGIIIGIAYREKVKNRKNFLQRPFNRQVRAACYKAAMTCKIILRKADIGDLPNLEKYFKYNIILLDEDYLDSQKVLYSSNSIFQKNIYLQWRPPWGINIIDSIKSYCGKNLFEKPIE